MNRKVSFLLWLGLLASTFKSEDADIDKFFKIKQLKEHFDKDPISNLFSNKNMTPKKPLTKEERANKIKNYRRFLMQLKETKYNTPEKRVIFNLVQEFLAKSIKERRLKLEECKCVFLYVLYVFDVIDFLTQIQVIFYTPYIISYCPKGFLYNAFGLCHNTNPIDC